ncbi:cupin domain-containing protein [Photobacterium minamisatsumaniensis]|uniref:cupin domain-containing protein n=1 Tax=Photobacterium minamisatsumaniensis TaxID=2910233 RepID=UPI003D120344
MTKWVWALLTFFIACLQANAATSRDLAKTTTSWDGQPLPSYNLKQPEITIKKIIIAPGEKLPLHQHPVINTGILLTGELTVHTKDKSVTIKAGDTLVEVMNTSHYGENNGSEPAKIIVFYFAEKGTKVTVLDH